MYTICLRVYIPPNIHGKQTNTHKVSVCFDSTSKKHKLLAFISFTELQVMLIWRELVY